MRRSALERGLFSLAVTVLLVAPAPALAEKLYSVWTLKQTISADAIDVRFGKPFLDQRLLPYLAAKLSAPAVMADGKQINEGTYLFAVYQADGQMAFCTVKDRSIGNAVKSAFVPALDKRPCFIDRDEDGRFELGFTVFDKYGSALTPSGNLSSATLIAKPVEFQIVDSVDFPYVWQFDYALTGSRIPEKTRIAVRFDNGKGFQMLSGEQQHAAPDTPLAFNLAFKIHHVTGDQASISLVVDPALYIVGESGGTFAPAALPAFVRQWQGVLPGALGGVDPA